jgi:O-antigen/teichoic acid export membrane protein
LSLDETSVAVPVDRPGVLLGLRQLASRTLDRLRSSVDARRSVVALFDQCVVSGTRFATTLVVGRVCGPEELGIFSLAMMPVFLLALMQEALVATPFMVHLRRRSGDARRRYVGSMIAMHAVLAATVFVTLAIAALVMPEFETLARWAPLAAVLSVVVPLTLLWEVARRYCFARLKMGHAALLDVTLAAIQLAGFALLAIIGRLTAVSALSVIAIGCGLVGLTWLILIRRQLAFRFRNMRLHAVRHWRFGRWLFASQAMGLLHGITPEWFLVVLMGTVATGTFAACHMLVLLPNPFIYGIGNLLVPRAAEAMNQGGPRKVAALVWPATLAMTALLATYAVVVALGGDVIVQLIFGGKYAGNGLTVALLGLCPIAGAATATTSAGLIAIGRPQAVFQARIVGLVVTVLTMPIAIIAWGIPGAALVTALGNCTAALLQAYTFRALTAR